MPQAFEGMHFDRNAFEILYGSDFIRNRFSFWSEFFFVFAFCRFRCWRFCCCHAS